MCVNLAIVRGPHLVPSERDWSRSFSPILTLRTFFFFGRYTFACVPTPMSQTIKQQVLPGPTELGDMKGLDASRMTGFFGVISQVLLCPMATINGNCSQSTLLKLDAFRSHFSDPTMASLASDIPGPLWVVPFGDRLIIQDSSFPVGSSFKVCLS